MSQRTSVYLRDPDQNLIEISVYNAGRAQAPDPYDLLPPVPPSTWPATMSPTARLPGGDIEPGKTPEQTVIRELAEEVGLKTLSVRYLYDAPYLSG
jgi:hypothetical protein